MLWSLGQHSVGGGGGFDPPDIASHDFNDGLSGPYTLSGTPPNGSLSIINGRVVQEWTFGAANQAAIYGDVSPTQKRVYARWVWNVPVVFGDGASILKILRFFDLAGGTILLSFLIHEGTLPLVWDAFGDALSAPNIVPLTFADIKDGQDHTYEVLCDLSVPGEATAKLWFDGTLHTNFTTSPVDHSALDIDRLAWTETFNADAATAQTIFDDAAHSTKRIGPV